MLFLTYPISKDFENCLSQPSAGGSANWYRPLQKQFVKMHQELKCVSILWLGVYTFRNPALGESFEFWIKVYVLKSLSSNTGNKLHVQETAILE